MAALLQDLQVYLQNAALPWQSVVLGVVLAVGVFEAYIGTRQEPFLNPIISPTLPATLQPYLPSSTSHDTFTKSQAYARAKLAYSSTIGRIDLLESFVLLTSVAAPYFTLLQLGKPPAAVFPWFGEGHGQWTLLKGFWDISGRVLGSGTTELRQSLVFATLLTTIGTVLSAPKEYYKNFVMEEEHGFNKMTKGTFVADQIKGLILSLVLEIPLIAGILWIINWVGSQGMLTVVAWVMAFIFSFQIIMIPAYPYLIAPLFNKFTPLPEDSPVFPRVKDLSAKLNFPLGRVWVMDGSKRSAHSNAFFFGLPYLTKHIVIYDTLLDKSSPEEVEAILAHELGHWAGKHVLLLLTTSLVQTGFSLLTFTLFLDNKPLLAAFGFTGRQSPTIVSLLLAATLFSPLSSVLKFISNGVTRALEYNADAFAVKLGASYAENLKGALVSIHEKNLAVYGVDPIYSAYHHNHPTLIERLDALDAQLDTLAAKGEAKKDL